MADGPVAERGVLTAPAEVWDVAVHRAEVISRLAAMSTVRLETADQAAAELGVSRRTDQAVACG
jgi:putative transposase